MKVYIVRHGEVPHNALKQYNNQNEDLTKKGIKQAEELREKIIPANREKVLQDIHTYIEYLKTGICNYIDIFEPEIVCFGGSFAYWKETALYKQLISEIMEPNATFNSAKPEFCTAEYNNDAGIIGATIIE